MDTKINVNDVVKFKLPELVRPSLGTVTQVYQITDALDPGLVDQKMYVVECGLELVRIWDDLIIDVYKKVDVGLVTEWIVWGGWEGNYDKRIEGVKCSKCGYSHPKVYNTLDNLYKQCPKCRSEMSIKII